jgi:RHS repeat-associated protein
LDGAGIPSGATSLYEPFGRRVDLAAFDPPAVAPPVTTAPPTTAGPATTLPPSTSTTSTTTAPSTTAPSTTSPSTTSTTTPDPAPSTTAIEDGEGPAGVAVGPASGGTAAAASPTVPVDPGYQLVDGVRLGAVDLLPMGARVYLPTLGSFLQPDPVIGGGGNPYAYADGDPVNGHDPSGNFTEWLEDVDWGAVGRWSAAVAIAIVGVGLAYAAGPAAGVLVSNSLTGTMTVGARLAVIGVTSAVVGWGVGVGAAYAVGGVMGWDISFANAAKVGAGLAAVSLVRPAIALYKSSRATMSFPFNGMGFRRGATAAWNDFKGAFGFKPSPLGPRTPISSATTSPRQSVRLGNDLDSSLGKQSSIASEFVDPNQI